MNKTRRLGLSVVLLVLGLVPEVVRAAPVEEITPAEAAAQAKAGQAVIVDVRERGEIASGMAVGARWYPTSSIQSDPGAFVKFVEGLPADQTVVFYCAAGVRANKAALIASQRAGRKAANLGGFKDWQAAGLPVTTPSNSLAPGS